MPCGLHGVRSHAQPVVEIEQHRRTLRGRDQQVFEFAESARADHVLLVVGEQHAVGAFVDEDVEVVEPEIGHHLFELAFAVDGAQQLGLHQFVGDDRLRVVHGLQRFFLLGIKAGEELLPFAAAERVGEGNLLVGGHGHDFLVALVGREIDESLNLQIGVETIFAATGLGFIRG